MREKFLGRTQDAVMAIAVTQPGPPGRLAE
jgi:hypothetical protein